jgi:hypothetical protein
LSRCDWVHHEPERANALSSSRSEPRDRSLTEPLSTVPHHRGAQPFRPPVSPPCPPRSGGKTRLGQSAGARLASHHEPAPVCDQTPVFLFPVQANGLVSTGKATCSPGGVSNDDPPWAAPMPPASHRISRVRVGIQTQATSTAELPWTPHRPVMWFELKPTKKGCSGECLNPRRLSQPSSSSWVDTASFQTNSYSYTVTPIHWVKRQHRQFSNPHPYHTPPT